MSDHIAKPSLSPWFASAMCLVCALLLAYLFVSKIWPVDRIWIALVVVCAAIVPVGIVCYQQFRLRRQVRNLDYRVCRKCFYNLTGLPDDGLCPECGKPYSRQSLAKHWGKALADYLGMRRRDPPQPP